jgi:hypothetical protein
MKTTQAQLQAYTKTHISLYLRSLVNDMWAPLINIIFFLSSSLTLQYLSPSMVSCSRAAGELGLARGRSHWRAAPRARALPRASSASHAGAAAGHSAWIFRGRATCHSRPPRLPAPAAEPVPPPSSSPPFLTPAPVLPRAPLCRADLSPDRAPPANLPTEEDEKKPAPPPSSFSPVGRTAEEDV